MPWNALLKANKERRTIMICCLDEGMMAIGYLALVVGIKDFESMLPGMLVRLKMSESR